MSVRLLLESSQNQHAIVLHPVSPFAETKNDHPLYQKILKQRILVSEARFSVWCQKSSALIPTGHGNVAS